MERLKEEENEEDAGEEKVRFPAKGADYVVLPTSDKVTIYVDILKHDMYRATVIKSCKD